MSKAFGRHVLINTLFINYKEVIVYYSWSSPHLQTSSHRQQILRSCKKPWKGHVALEMYPIMPSSRGSQKCRRVERSNTHIFLFQLTSSWVLSAVLFSLFSCAGGRAICQGSAYSLPSFCQACSMGKMWAAAPQLAREAGLQFSHPLGALSSISGCTQGSDAIVKLLIGISDRFSSDHIDFWSTVSLFSLRAKTVSLGCLVMKLIRRRCPGHFDISPALWIITSFHFKQPSGIACC